MIKALIFYAKECQFDIENWRKNPTIMAFYVHCIAFGDLTLQRQVLKCNRYDLMYSFKSCKVRKLITASVEDFFRHIIGCRQKIETLLVPTHFS